MYLDTRSRQRIEELPVVRSETGDRGNKGVHAMYALRDVLGADRVNLALKRFIEKYGNRPPPNPTTRELVAELRAVAGEEYQALITDWFERITFYDVAVTGAQERAAGDGYEVDDRDRGAGSSTSTAPASRPRCRCRRRSTSPCSRQAQTRRPSRSISRSIGSRRARSASSCVCPREPGRVAVDPYGLMLDRRAQDNARDL